ncbi:MAG: glycoside hydrolase family 127 protein, partial [Candidatus Obscuribacterales bacterium]|nr:glycoside hydrolase family 127 protein [Candidatus Obscuribacterales bacterium]
MSHLSRRNFIRGASLAALAFNPHLWTKQAFASAPVANNLTAPLKEFAYAAVKFQDGLPQKQLDDTINVLMNLSEDSILKPYRVRSGLPAPGEDLGGWYDEDPSYNFETGNEHGFAPGHCFGQWVSALSRAYAISGSEPLKNKAHRLISLYAET